MPNQKKKPPTSKKMGTITRTLKDPKTGKEIKGKTKPFMGRRISEKEFNK